MQNEEYQHRREQMDVYLKSRCSGLLEIQKKQNFPPERRYLKVVYLHRTVKDFLDTEDVRAVLSLDTAPISQFEPNVWALMSYITRLRRSVFLTYDNPVNDPSKAPGINNHNVWLTGNLAMEYAAKAEEAGDTTYVAMLDALEKAISRCLQGSDFYWRDGNHLIWEDKDLGCQVACHAHLKTRLRHNSLLTKAVSLDCARTLRGSYALTPNLVATCVVVLCSTFVLFQVT